MDVPRGPDLKIRARLTIWRVRYVLVPLAESGRLEILNEQCLGGAFKFLSWSEVSFA